MVRSFRVHGSLSKLSHGNPKAWLEGERSTKYIPISLKHPSNKWFGFICLFVSLEMFHSMVKMVHLAVFLELWRAVWLARLRRNYKNWHSKCVKMAMLSSQKTQFTACPCYHNLFHCIMVQLRLHSHIEKGRCSLNEKLRCFSLNPLFSLCSPDNIWTRCWRQRVAPAAGRCDWTATLGPCSNAVFEQFSSQAPHQTQAHRLLSFQKVTKVTKPQGMCSLKVTPKCDMCRCLTVKLLLQAKRQIPLSLRQAWWLLGNPPPKYDKDTSPQNCFLAPAFGNGYNTFASHDTHTIHVFHIFLSKQIHPRMDDRISAKFSDTNFHV